MFASTDQPIAFENGPLNEAGLDTCCREIIRRSDQVRGTGRHLYKISFDLGGVYIRDNILFCYLEVENKSNVGYDIDFIRFYLRDRKSACQTAVQET